MTLIDDYTRLNHMIEAAQKAIEFVRMKKRAHLDEDEMLCLALVRLLEIIGEAAGGISATLREKYPQIAWRQMANMRHRLIHGYFEINNDIVWETVTEELPTLIIQLQALVRDEAK